MDKVCNWRWDEMGMCWDTDCGWEHDFPDGGTPAENAHDYCHHCGGKIHVPGHPDYEGDPVAEHGARHE